MNRFMRPGVAIVAVAVLMLLAATIVLAQESFLSGKVRVGQSITVASGETWDGDLYLFAGTVTMDGTVDGDLVAFGGTVHVNGTVTGDVLASGGQLEIAGTVDGDVRVAGGQVTVSGPVGEDVLAAGGQAQLSSGGSVGGDLIISGGQVTLAGSVTGSVEGRAGSYEKTGTIGGSENVVIPDKPDLMAGNTLLDAFRHFVALLLFGGLLLWLLPRSLRASTRAIRERPVAALGGGLAFFVGWIAILIVAVLAIVLLAVALGLLRMVALVGIELAGGILAVSVLSFGLLLAVAYAGDLVVGMLLGRLLAPGPFASRWMEFGLLAAGAAVVVIATSLPEAGGWIKLVVVIIGLGGITLAAYDAWQGRRGRTAVTGEEPTPAA